MAQSLSGKLAFIVATSGGAGLSPAWPGTAGAVVGVAFAWLVSGLSPLGLAAALAALTAFGIWASEAVCRALDADDPQTIVIDETVGTAATLAVLPLDPFWWAAGFLAFRFFDVVKPWPVNLAQDRIKGGLGVMLDDVLAAVYAGGLLLAIRELLLRL